MIAGGWAEAPSMGEHFGQKLTKDGVTSVFHRNPDDTGLRDHAALRRVPQHGRPPRRRSGMDRGRPLRQRLSRQAALQQHGVEPPAVLEPDRRSAVRRRRSPRFRCSAREAAPSASTMTAMTCRIPAPGTVASSASSSRAADAAADRVAGRGTPSPPRCGGTRAASSTVRSRRSRRPRRRESR